MRPNKGAREERFAQLEDLEVREGTDGRPIVAGIAIRYNTWSDPIWGMFREQFAPSAFTKTLQESDVRSLFNHDPNYVIGRTKSGTLKLEDSRGALRYEATPPRTSWADDLIESMRRGDIDGSSFAFRVIKDEWDETPDEEGLVKRTVTEAQLYDVSPVTFPAYSTSSSSIRSTLIDVGIDFEALAALMQRHQRSVTLTPSDIDMLNSSIAVLRSLVPIEPEPQETGGNHSEPEEAGRSVDHLRRLLDLKAVEV